MSIRYKDTDLKRVILSANTCWYIFNFRRSTIIALLADNFELHVVAPHDAYTSLLEALGAQVHHIDLNAKSLNPWREAIALGHYFRIYSKLKPAVVLNFTPKVNVYSALAASWVRSRIVNNVSGQGATINRSKKFGRFIDLLYKTSFRKVDWVFFQNQDDQTAFKTKKLLRSTTIEQVIPGSGVDLIRFAATPLQQSQERKFLLAARLIPQKGVLLYIDAARQLIDTARQTGLSIPKFVIAGFFETTPIGKHVEACVRTAAEQGIIDYLGPTDAIETVIAEHHVVVLPTYYGEGVPKILLEAAAMGRPVITTNMPGCREVVVDTQTGLLCQPNCQSSLQAAMSRLIEMPAAELQKMGQAGRERMLSLFNEELVVEPYRVTVKQLAGDHLRANLARSI